MRVVGCGFFQPGFLANTRAVQTIPTLRFCLRLQPAAIPHAVGPSQGLLLFCPGAALIPGSGEPSGLGFGLGVGKENGLRHFLGIT